ncbi:kinase domain-containing [Lecanosticta acicola]|uniref:non-specific serine/threonine protein kinase n=1 Tax=Lecanosticta acicola TaxID=111012 RepID=A0AAI8YXJ1_9PEZI|nr:kinase domain-containing [Lecanosticta acicola]
MPRYRRAAFPHSFPNLALQLSPVAEVDSPPQSSPPPKAGSATLSADDDDASASLSLRSGASFGSRAKKSPPLPQSSQLFSPVKNTRNRIVKNGGRLDTTTSRTLAWRNGRHVVVKEVSGKATITASRLRGVRRFLGHENLVRLLDWEGFAAGDPRASKLCVYEYCDSGTLGDRIDRFPDGLPESFIWHVLKGLLKAALYMHTGRTYGTKSDSIAEDFRPSVHNMINPDTIYFQRTDYVSEESTPQQWIPHQLGDLHPRVKLSNFSRLILLDSPEQETWDPSESLTPIEWMTHFEAPELTWNDSYGTYKSSSDMWSIGAVAIAMMGGIRPSIEPKLPGIQAEPLSKEAEFTFKSLKRESWSAMEMPQKYSKFLRLCVAELLKMSPRERIDAKAAVDLVLLGEVWWELKEADELSRHGIPEYSEEDVQRMMSEFNEKEQFSPSDEDLCTPPEMKYPGAESPKRPPIVSPKEKQEFDTKGTYHPPYLEEEEAIPTARESSSLSNNSTPSYKPIPGAPRPGRTGFRSSPYAPPREDLYKTLPSESVPALFGGSKPTQNLRIPSKVRDRGPSPPLPEWSTHAERMRLMQKLRRNRGSDEIDSPTGFSKALEAERLRAE